MNGRFTKPLHVDLNLIGSGAPGPSPEQAPVFRPRPEIHPSDVDTEFPLFSHKEFGSNPLSPWPL